MMHSQETSPESARDRLEMLERRIARMRSFNVKHGDVLALRLIEHAETERRQILAEIAAGTSKAR